eukprot:Pgem_evm1s13621
MLDNKYNKVTVTSNSNTNDNNINENNFKFEHCTVERKFSGKSICSKGSCGSLKLSNTMEETDSIKSNTLKTATAIKCFPESSQFFINEEDKENNYNQNNVEEKIIGTSDEAKCKHGSFESLENIFSEIPG